MIEPVDLLTLVLAVAALIGCINHLWLKLPPAIGMLLGSLFLSLLIVSSDRLFHLHIMSRIRDTLDAANLPHVFLNGLLALLLFAGSLHVDVAELTRRAWLILLFATASVILSTLVFGVGIWLAFSALGAAVPLAWCFVLGAIVTPTDAVVIEGVLRHVNLPADLRVAIVGESLFNDGAGVVLFLLALGVTQGQALELGHGQVLVALVREIGGGAVLGGAAGLTAAAFMRRIEDETLELLISFALVLGCYRLAILFDLSGPIAVVTAGLCMASRSRVTSASSPSRTMVIGFWTQLDEVLNSLLFLLIGLQILGLVVEPAELLPIVFAIPLAIVSRMISVGLPLTLTRDRFRHKARDTAVLTWAGLRGGISIALALTLPASTWRTSLLVVTYAIVVFSIVVQGLTLSPFLRAVFGGKSSQLSQESRV